MKMKTEPIPREHYMSILRESRDSDFIKVLTGIRRCGKSTLMLMFLDEIKHLGVPEEKTVYINLDDEELEINDFRDLLSRIREEIGGYEGSYVFLDEVQNVKEWERAVSTLYLNGADVYVTGSNTQMLSTDISGKLSGRCQQIRVRPLIFSEYLDFREPGDTTEIFMDYLRYGGFPSVALAMDAMPSQVIGILDGIYNTVFTKDVVLRNSIRNASTVRNLLRYLMKNIGDRTSVRGAANYMTSKGMKVQAQTVEQYIDALEHAQLFDRVGRMDSKSKEYLRTSDKFYASDLGIRNNLIPFSERDLDGIMENLVYNELMFRYGEAAVYSVDGYEVDFIADPRGSPSYYQVCTDISEKSMRERELRSLKAIPDNYPKTVITFEKYPLRDIDGIRIVNIQDWLLEGKSPQA